jgi:pimeloyl-ACP methyl ester carboxylesterase
MTSRPVGFTLSLALLILSFCFPFIINASETVPLAPWGDKIDVNGAECGTLEVYEDRAAGTGRRISLSIAVLPALSRDRQPDPLFMLAGGPGMAASFLAQSANGPMRRIREKRDIVLVDQRGTGDSHPLDCEALDPDSTYYMLEGDLQVQPMRDCLEDLLQDADVRHYTTPIAMDDLDDVRAALGYDQINLWGGSYGSRAALVYLRRHSEHVRAVIVDGLAPPALQLPLYIGEDAARALELMLADCERDPDCSGAFPQLRDKWSQLLARLEAEPDQVRLPHPRTGEIGEFTITRSGVVLLVRATLYVAEASTLLPLIIERAHERDYAPLLALADPWVGVAESMSVGMMFSVLCSEDISRISDEERQDLAHEPLLGSTIVDQWGSVCDFWPLGELPPGYHEPVISDKPTLVLSGELDPVTPPRWGELTAQHLSNSRHVVVPGVAHGTSGTGCIPRMMAQFIDSASLNGLDTQCVEELRRPMFFRSFAGPRVGTIEAIEATDLSGGQAE